MKNLKRITLLVLSFMMLFSVSVFAKTSPVKTSFNAALKQATITYDGKKHSPSVVVKDENGTKIEKKYYTVTAKKNVKDAGKYTVTVKGKGKYAGYVQKLTYKINQKTQKVTLKKDDFTVKYNKNKATTKTIKVNKKAGKVTYTTNSSNIKVDKNGKITVAKGTKKGIYSVTVTVKAKNYKTVKRYVRVTVK